MSAEDMIIMSTREQKRVQVVTLLSTGAISQQEAADQLDLSVRQIRRLLVAFLAHGAKGLVSKKRGSASNKQLCPLLAARVLERIAERYLDFGPTFAHEKLVEEDGFSLSLSSVRRLMIEANIWHPKIQKVKKIHPRRERRSRYGELVQIDGSPHDWFEGRAPKCCLIVFIDDATSALLGLRFSETETTFVYFQVLRFCLKEHGRPQALYSDKHAIFRVNTGCEQETKVTQFSRALKELDIRIICAHSPQAKGCVERANGILQDRLVKELRLRKISSIEAANTFLPEFRKDYNRRFAKAPKNLTNAHRTLDCKHDLERILSIHDTRKVSKTLSFQFENTHYQILEEGYQARQLIGSKVQVVKTMKGTTRIFYQDRELTFTQAELVSTSPKTVDSKELNSEFEKWLNKKERYRPPANHPLKKWKLK